MDVLLGNQKKKVGESSLTGNEMQPKAVSICKNHLLGCFLNVSKYECNPFGNVCFAKPSHYWCVQKLSTFSPQLSRVSFLLWFCIEKGEKALPILPCTEIKSRLWRLFSSFFLSFLAKVDAWKMVGFLGRVSFCMHDCCILLDYDLEKWPRLRSSGG